MGFSNADIDAFNANLAAVYNLEETSGTRFDEIGSNDLSDTNTVGSAAGKDGTAASFVRSNSECLESSTAAADPTADMAINLWFNAPDSTFSAMFSQHKLIAPAKESPSIQFTPGGIIRVDQQTDANNILLSSGFSTGAFHNVVYIIDGNDHFVYVDGGLEDSATFTTGSRAIPENLNLGCRDFGAGNSLFMDGLLDAVYVWNGPSFGGGNPTKQNFVDALFNGGAGRFFELGIYDPSFSRVVRPVDNFPVHHSLLE